MSKFTDNAGENTTNVAAEIFLLRQDLLVDLHLLGEGSEQSIERLLVDCQTFSPAKAKKIGVLTASGNAERIKGLAKLYLSPWELDSEEVEEIDRVGKTIHYRFYVRHLSSIIQLAVQL